MHLVHPQRFAVVFAFALILVSGFGCSKDKPIEDPADASAALQAGREDLRDPKDGGSGSAGAMDDAAALADLPPVYFAFDRAEVRKAEIAKVRRAAELLEKYPDVKMRFEGHADERGSADYNFILGQRRADSVLELMRSYGVASNRLSTRSFGEEFPAVRGQNEAAWSQNRRVEFVIVK